MKHIKWTLTGGFLGVIGSLWFFRMMEYTENNLLSAWSGNRFWASAGKLGTTLPLILSLALAALGLAVLAAALLRKDD